MRKKLLVGLSALLIIPLSALIGRSSAWGDEGDAAFAAYSVGNYSRSLQLARPAAEAGNFLAQHVMGRIYEQGKGAAQNKTEAEKWFQKSLDQAKPAAQSGDMRAQFVLGRMYFRGRILPKDNDQAVSWFRKAAAQGFPAAQTSLGVMYLNGLGVAKNNEEAVSWYRKAAEQDFAPAQFLLGTMYEDGAGVAKNNDEAVSWYRKAAEQGIALAQTQLGNMYFAGRGIAVNHEEALSWYRKAAEQGDPEAQAMLGTMYLSGIGTRKDYKEALLWNRKAADQGQTQAQYNLGVQLAIGQGIHKNLDESASWVRKAAEQGLADAQYTVGFNYENGLFGFEKDDSQALFWYRKAAEQDFVPASRDHKPGDLWDDARAKRPELRSPQSSPTTAAISREEIQAMVQSAAKDAAKNQAPTPKAVQSDVDTPGYKAPENPNDFAVVIGVEKYASLPAAEFAERDAEAVRAHLTALGYPERNIFFLSGQQATRAKLAQSLNTWLPSRVTEKSTVFFYYSGHGAPDPQTSQAYLVPVDGDAEDLESTAYPIKQLYEKLGKLKARHVIVALDSCFSGAGGRSVLAKGTRPLLSKIDLGIVPANVIALAASEKSQVSGTIEDQGHGAFTYYMLKGLAGAAKNGSGHVTAQSLFDYLTPKVQDAARLHNRDQTPQLLPARSGQAQDVLR